MRVLWHPAQWIIIIPVKIARIRKSWNEKALNSHVLRDEHTYIKHTIIHAPDILLPFFSNLRCWNKEVRFGATQEAYDNNCTGISYLLLYDNVSLELEKEAHGCYCGRHVFLGKEFDLMCIESGQDRLRLQWFTSYVLPFLPTMNAVMSVRVILTSSSIVQWFPHFSVSRILVISMFQFIVSISLLIIGINLLIGLKFLVFVYVRQIFSAIVEDMNVYSVCTWSHIHGNLPRQNLSISV